MKYLKKQKKKLCEKLKSSKRKRLPKITQVLRKSNRDIYKKNLELRRFLDLNKEIAKRFNTQKFNPDKKDKFLESILTKCKKKPLKKVNYIYLNKEVLFKSKKNPK